MLIELKKGNKIYIKPKNRGKFTKYCHGKVTDECIRRGKDSSSATIRKRATFAANARKWKHLFGGVMTAGKKAKSNLTKRKDPNWDNLDRGYRYLTLDMKLPHDLAIALMGNVVEESQGNYQAVLKGGPGKGLIQWEKSAPSGRYSLWGKILTSVTKPANVYDPKTDTVKNYWASWNGLKGELVRQRFKTAPLKEKTRIYAESYLRPGKPRIKDRQLSAMQLDSIYNPKIKNIIVNKKGGKAFVEGVNALDSNPKAYKHVKKKYKMALLGTKLQIASAIGNIGMGIFNTIQQNSTIDKSIENMKVLAELDKKKLFLLNFKTALGQLTDRSLIVNSNRAFKLAGLTDYSSINDKFLLLLQELLNKRLENSNKMLGYIGEGVLLLASNLWKKNNGSNVKNYNIGDYNTDYNIGDYSINKYNDNNIT